MVCWRNNATNDYPSELVPLEHVRTEAEHKLSVFLVIEDNSLIDERFLALLRCPIDGTELANADHGLVAQLNQEIAAGQLRDRLDQLIDDPIDSALVTQDGKRIYVVRKEIPTLISDEAIER